MKQLVRFFSLGLLTAGIIMLGVVLISDNKKENNLSAEELIPVIEEEGYHVVSNDEYIAMTVNPNENKPEQNSDEADKNSDKEKSEKKDESKDKEKEVNETDDEQAKKDEKEDKKEDENKSYVLNVESGMPTSSISNILEENGIIDKASDFTKYLEKHDYSLKVKAKETKVTSDMSYYELAQALMNY
ncbi:endolytic transglycosylase MltG [Oceanobacillus caeni]|uniref:endolytic transglycosylase MltG n=1 Tax=Oceanobacillus caeni TaxID=405946 RepID=UPI001C232FE9|nr:endolytic transglycosylase MltG [Oceanobacillus caeni]MBU8789861.1 endolytic transglycosylase MltG [Oceanobacillus caeni]